MRKIIFGVLLALFQLLSACAARVYAPSAAPGGGKSPAASYDAAVYRKITAKKIKAMIDKGGVAVVDVRRAGEYVAGHIPGTILVTRETIGAKRPQAPPDLNAALLGRCRAGVRSEQASDKLVKLGSQNVYDCGGIIAWPYEIVTGDGAIE